MVISPIVKQLLVAGSPQLAALSAGGVVGYPSVLLHQLNSNDSSIPMDFDTASWIGSIHGLAGIPSVLMPAIMQWRGRKFAFIAACLLTIIGWILTYLATNIVMLLVSESFHGLGSNSLFFASYAIISEMVTPKVRSMSMISYGIFHALGMAMVGIIGRYLHWQTVSLLFGAPIVVALLIVFIWPESPYWLACMGEFDRCQKAFTWLRGTDEDSMKELNALIATQKEILHSNECLKSNKITLKGFWWKLRCRDFYLPIIHVFVILLMIYWCGVIVLLIYATQMIEETAHSEKLVFIGAIALNLILFFGNCIATVLTKYFNNKSILLFSSCGTAVCLFIASVVRYMQYVDVLSKDSLLSLYCLIAYMIAGSLGLSCIGFTVATELIPVKHRGIIGALYTIFACTLQSSVLKLSPYLFRSIEVWGTFLVYMFIVTICSWFVWMYVPETKNRTLQEIEDFYNNGRFVRTRVMDNSVEVPLSNDRRSNEVN